MHWKFGSLLLVALSTFACDGEPETDTAADETDGDTNPNCGCDPVREALESDCFDACDDIYLIDCVTSEGHDACWDACHEASDIALESFTECVDDTLPMCDPQCVDGLLDSAGIEPPPEA